MYLKTALYLLLFTVIFLNKTDGLFLLFRLVFLIIRGRIKNSMGIYKKLQQAIFGPPPPTSHRRSPYYNNFLLTLMWKK